MNKNKKPLFRKANKTCRNHGFIKKVLRNKDNDSYEFKLLDDLDYIFDYSDFITDKEIRQLPEILTLEEWFEKEKINK